MSVTMTKAEGVTVFTLTSDPQSAWPPLCQIFKGLCYSPVCCSVSQQLRRIQRTSQSVLGTLQIMVGLLNLGFGAVLFGSEGGVGWQIRHTVFPFWLGALFIVFGIVCILSEKYPSPCLVILTLVLNLAGVAFAITAIVMYSINVANIYLGYWYCDRDHYYYGYGRHHTTTTPSPERDVLQEKCLEARELAQMLLRGINGVLIVLSVLELCVVISSVVLGIKALRSRQKESNKSAEEPESFKPLLDEVTTDPGA
ncbi:transmembrane protein 176B isoform X2 [Amphiprion ocellaris]|uniref:Transmembrane protein 176l.4 n=1 Tax=Amphiprion ocellaris TaxID=80972 RepID=A0A3Q1CJT2_AMPOC|nr:transmembrane protein 176B isoform X2 [Amphiprion ocellaris]XP_054869767.1 transmembrane protein 176B isoform X2 [Amphiprion ocellaris]